MVSHNSTFFLSVEDYLAPHLSARAQGPGLPLGLGLRRERGQQQRGQRRGRLWRPSYAVFQLFG